MILSTKVSIIVRIVQRQLSFKGKSWQTIHEITTTDNFVCIQSNILQSKQKKIHTKSLNHQDVQQTQEQSILTKSNYNQLKLPPCPNSFKASDVFIKTLDQKNRSTKPSWDKLIFGHHCSDHMVEIHWSESQGWDQPKIVPVHPICLHPFAKVFHYAPEIFEGMKAYRGPDSQVRIFRPELNMKRMRLSAARLCLPDFDGQELIQLIKNLLKIDNEWIPPYESNASLYIRPTMIATDEALGVSPATKAILFVVTGPVGPYFNTGFKPVSLLADPKYVRAWPGGSGDRKLGANYAPTMLVQKEAVKQGLQQVLWLYGPDHQLTEVGTMNIFILIKSQQGQLQLVTPPLSDGLILPGVTRQSLIDLVRSWNEIEVIERIITIKEVEKLLAENRLLEMFGSGTACIVCPVGQITFQQRTLEIPDHKFALKLFNELLSIQYGIKKHADWVQII